MSDRHNVVNLDELDGEQSVAGDSFASHRKQLASAAGGELLGCSYYEVPPGKAAWPRHGHFANEEGIFVLEGEGTLRLGEEEFEVGPEQWIALPANTGRAHQLRNSGDQPLKYVCVSTMETPEIGYYPDSDKLGVFAGSAPGAARSERTLHGFLRTDAAVSYWHGEEPGGAEVAPVEVVGGELPQRWPPIIGLDEADVREVSHGERFRLQGHTFGWKAGSQKLGATLYHCAAGHYSFPRHAHLANEEALFVLDGRGVSIAGDVETPIRPGDYVVYPRGEQHAHHVRADEAADLRYLCFSTTRSPEVVLYPDSEKVGAFGGGERLLLDRTATLGYWDREPEE